MADFDAIRHALSLARDRGFAEVAIESDDLEFKAVLAPEKVKPSARPKAVDASEDEEDAGPKLSDITASLVGYYSPGAKPLTVGERVEVGDMVATIAQLGIVNDVEAKISGEVMEVLVEENQPVMYGQVLARIKE